MASTTNYSFQIPLAKDGSGNDEAGFAKVTVSIPNRLDSDEFRQSVVGTLLGELRVQIDQQIIEKLRQPVVGQTATLELNE